MCNYVDVTLHQFHIKPIHIYLEIVLFRFLTTVKLIYRYILRRRHQITRCLIKQF